MSGRDACKVIAVASLVRLQTGTVTSRFITAANIDHDSKSQHNALLVECQDECLSLIHLGDNGCTLETLDLMVPDKRDYAKLKQTLEDLIQLYTLERKLTITSLQHLQYLWTACLHKSLDSELTASEWMTLCDQLQLPLKRSLLNTMFAQDVGDMEGLTLLETAGLLQDVQEAATEFVTGQTSAQADPLEALWYVYDIFLVDLGQCLRTWKLVSSVISP